MLVPEPCFLFILLEAFRNRRAAAAFLTLYTALFINHVFCAQRRRRLSRVRPPQLARALSAAACAAWLHAAAALT
jgi:hypothetical protein